MRTPTRRIAVLVVLGSVLLALCLQGSAASASGATRSTSATLIINDSIAPATLDPSVNPGFYVKWNVNFYRQLLRMGRKPGPYAHTTVADPAQIEPDVAKSWTESKDGLTYTFHLDPNAKFNDGTTITSHAIKFTFDRAVNLHSAGAYSYWTAEIGYPNVTMSTPNATTVVVHLKKPDQLLLGAYAYPGGASILEPKIVQQHPDVPGQAVNEYWADHIAGGGGPFVLDQYSPGKQIIMSRNMKYTGPTPAHVQKAIVNFGMSEATLLLQARSGAADITFGLNPADLGSLQKTDHALRVLRFPVQQFYDLGLNNKLPPFNNLKVRKALAYAVPYKQIVNSVLDGMGRAYYGPLVPTLPHFNPKLSTPVPYDPDVAKALLAQSGVNLPLDITIAVQQGAVIPTEMATVLQAAWKPLGINVTVQSLGTAEYNTVVLGHKAAAFIRVDGPGVSDEAWLLGYDMVCDVAGNNSQICIPQADKLFAEIQATQDSAKQQLLYDQITTIWRAQYPKVILSAIENGFAVSKSVKTFDAPVIAPEEVDLISK